LFSTAFYQNCFNALKEDGILVAQGESPKFNEKAFKELNFTLQEIFGTDKAPVSLFFVPTYPTGMWSFQYGLKGNVGQNQVPEKPVIDSFVSENGLRYYNHGLQTASFALPNFVADLVKK
jgi:spermidine synthase